LEGDSIIDVLGYEVRPVSMQHTVPSVGFMVRSKDGGCIGYTGDTSGGLSAFFQGASPVSLLFVDLSFPDRLIGLARLTGHLTPDLLRKEILEGLEHNFDLPRIVPVHLSQYHEEEIAREVARLSQELGRDLVIGREDMEIEVGVESRTGCPVSRGSPSGNHGFSVPLL
jgi:hypothetical protein